jgi:DNA-binding CsgD family transcriptional regulator
MYFTARVKRLLVQITSIPLLQGPFGNSAEKQIGTRWDFIGWRTLALRYQNRSRPVVGKNPTCTNSLNKVNAANSGARKAGKGSLIAISTLPPYHYQGAHFSRQVFKGLLTSNVGFGVLDRRFRYRLVNEALAAMHRIPAEAHLGETLRSMTGNGAVKIEPALGAIFDTGEVVSSAELIGSAPRRSEGVHWTGTHFPIRDGRGKIKEVGVIVVEVGSGIHNRSAIGANKRLLQKLVRDTSRTQELASRLLLLNGCSLFRADSEWILNGVTKTPGRFESHSENGSSVTLSDREREIVRLMANGVSNKEISAALGISVKTVECHRSRVFLKLKLESVATLVRYAIRNHIVEP